MKKINNKGYMLVEIIVAFSLAIAIMYIITELTVKVKNRNDDLRVRTLTASDQAIIYNTIMKDIVDNKNTFDCDNVQIDKDNNKITYTDKNNNKSVNILNEYVENISCHDDTIHIGVKVLDDNFDVVIHDSSSTSIIPENPSVPDDSGGSGGSGGACSKQNYMCDFDRLVSVRFTVDGAATRVEIGTDMDYFSSHPAISAMRCYGYKREYYEGYSSRDENTSCMCESSTCAAMVEGSTVIGGCDPYEVSGSCSVSGSVDKVGDNTLTIELNGHSEDFVVTGY